jgi:hypothetical protein
MDWELFHGCLNTVIFSWSSWAIFRYDEDAPGKKGAICISDPKTYPAPGIYILLSPGSIHLIFYNRIFHIADVLQMVIQYRPVSSPLRVVVVIRRSPTQRQEYVGSNILP